jgi:hypothetical protein
MPINKEEFETGNLHSEMENEITSFLKERKDSGFTSQEIMGGLHYHTDFSTPEVAKISTFVLTDFTNLLHNLVRLGKIRMKVVRDRMYFMASGDSAKCPKCKTEIASPRKTWRMAGRQDKMGKRLELHIGLYDCPKHGAFRSVLDKRKI